MCFFGLLFKKGGWRRGGGEGHRWHTSRHHHHHLYLASNAIDPGPYDIANIQIAYIYYIQENDVGVIMLDERARGMMCRW